MVEDMETKNSPSALFFLPEAIFGHFPVPSSIGVFVVVVSLYFVQNL